MNRRPRVLDLFCGAGGCSVGYHRAGYDVTGVDLTAHPDYPYPMLVTDAVAFLQAPAFLDAFDLVHASPPCPRYSTITRAADRDSHPDLVPVVRDALRAWGGPYVIENVPGAPMDNPVKLCGSMFGLGVRRHRLFETNVPVMMDLECQHHLQPQVWGVYGNQQGDRQYRRPCGTRRGDKAHGVPHAQQVLGIDWMHRWDDLTDAIPPAYTQWLGEQLLGYRQQVCV